jgi:hypothetical protein
VKTGDDLEETLADLALPVVVKQTDPWSRLTRSVVMGSTVVRTCGGREATAGGVRPLAGGLSMTATQTTSTTEKQVLDGDACPQEESTWLDGHPVADGSFSKSPSWLLNLCTRGKWWSTRPRRPATPRGR